MTITLRGITWDHPRGYDCLAANTRLFTQYHPDVEVVWDRRSLQQFGEEPIDDLCDRYDIIVVDHPFVGHAANTGCLVDLSMLLSQSELESLRGDSVGPSTVSYYFEGCIYGLPTDAAAQVACYRPDLLEKVGVTPPQTFNEVLDLATRARDAGQTIALPACPVDASCLLLTFTANLGYPFAENSRQIPDGAVLDEALGRIGELLAMSHPNSLDWNPIQTFEAMISQDEIVYVPFAFGYSNYSRTGLAKPLHFCDIAGPGPDPLRGALLGGAGCAVTRSARNLPQIADYLRFVHDPEHQRTDYFAAGGQPGSRAAWLDDGVNAAVNGFFENTLKTLDASYLRPRHDGFIGFFEAAGQILNAHFRGNSTRSAAIADLNEEYNRSWTAATH